jgi:hypothetical protein
MQTSQQCEGSAWTGQPRRTTGLERLGFYGDTWAALRVGLRTVPRVGPPDHATRRAAGPRYAPGRRAALRTGLRYASGRRAALHARPTTASPHRWTFGPTDGGVGTREDADTYQWTSRPRAPGVYSRIHVPYAGTTLGGRTRAAVVYYTPLDRTTRAASSACTC